MKGEKSEKGGRKLKEGRIQDLSEHLKEVVKSKKRVAEK